MKHRKGFRWKSVKAKLAAIKRLVRAQMLWVRGGCAGSWEAMRSGVAALNATLRAVSPAGWRAAWPGVACAAAVAGTDVVQAQAPEFAKDGAEFGVNAFTFGGQARQRVARDAQGNFVVVWDSPNQASASSQSDVILQRFNAQGAKVGSEIVVPTFTTNNQSNPAVAMATNGNFVVVWASFNNPGGNQFDIYFQRFNAAGVAQGGETLANSFTTSFQGEPDVAMDDDGDFVVAWRTYTAGTDTYNGIAARRFNASGTPQGADIQVNTYTTGGQFLPQVAADSNGDFVTVWISANQDGSGYGVYGQRFNAAGTPQGVEFRANDQTLFNQTAPTVAMDSAGDFVVAWQSEYQDGSYTAAMARRYNAAGVAQGSEFVANTETLRQQSNPHVAMERDGDFVIVWDSVQQDGDSNGVVAQRFNSTGVKQEGELLANTFTTSSQRLARVAVDADGDFVVVWQSSVQDGGSTGIFGQRFGRVTLETISVTPVTPTIMPSDTLQFSAMATYNIINPRNVTTEAVWSSLNTMVASVDSAGLATGLTEGTSDIRASIGMVQGQTTLTVSTMTVPPVLTSIAVTPANATLQTNTTAQFTATGSYSVGADSNITTQVIWQSQDPGIAMVDGGGLVSAMVAGSTTIRAISGMVTGATMVTVTESEGSPILTAIEVTPANPSIGLSDNVQFIARGTYANRPESNITFSVLWESDDPAVAIVHPSLGFALPSAPGSIAIRASLDGIEGSTVLSVTSAPSATTGGGATGGTTAGSGTSAGGTTGAGGSTGAGGTTGAGGVTGADTGAGGTTAGGSGSGTGILPLDWIVTLKKPKSEKPVKFKPGKSGVGTVKGTIETDLPPKFEDLDVEVALVMVASGSGTNTNGATNAVVVAWEDATKIKKVNKKGITKFTAKKFGADAELESGDTFEIWVRASTNFTAASTDTNKTEFEVK